MPVRLKGSEKGRMKTIYPKWKGGSSLMTRLSWNNNKLTKQEMEDRQ